MTGNPPKDTVREKTWQALDDLVDQASAAKVEEFLLSLPAGEAAFAVSHLTRQDQTQLLSSITPDTAAEVIEQFPDPQAADILEDLKPDAAAAIMSELSSADQADLFNELARSNANAILAEMTAEDAQDLIRLSNYPSDVAGGLMSNEFAAFEESLSVGNVLDLLRDRGAKYRDFDIQYLYVTDALFHLRGVLRTRDLLLASPATSVKDIMIRNPHAVFDTATLDSLEDFFDHHDFLAAPVINAKKELVGIVQRIAVLSALEERNASDFRKTQGIIGGEELRSMPLLLRTRRRLGWLSINIVLNLISASVIALYQDTLAAAISLAVFLPIISDMSGCSGNQAIAVSIRELSLGLVRPAEIFRVWRKELGVGVINGFVLGGLLASIGWLWKGNFVLGGVVGAALALNTIVAVSVGAILPLLLKFFRFDPALASGPILTTVTDLCGFLFVLSIATSFLAYL